MVTLDDVDTGSLFTCQVLHGDVTVEPGLLAAADALGPGHTGLGDGEALLTAVTPLSLSLSN